ALSRTTSTATPTGGTRVLEGAALLARPLPGPAGPAVRTLGGEATGWLGRDVTRVHPAATLADWWASLVIGRRRARTRRSPIHEPGGGRAGPGAARRVGRRMPGAAAARSTIARAAAAAIPVLAMVARRVLQVVRQHAVVREVVRQLEPDVLLDRLEPVHALLAGERDRVPRSARARRAAGAVEIVLGVEREVVVDHVRHVVDVESARRDVGGAEDRQRPVLEVGEEAEPSSLIDVAGDRRRGEAIGDQVALEPLRRALHVSEDQPARGRTPPEQAHEQRQLLVQPDVVDQVLDVLRRHLLRCYRDLLGRVHEDVGQLHDVVAERGREQHGLAAVERGGPG